MASRAPARRGDRLRTDTAWLWAIGLFAAAIVMVSAADHIAAHLRPVSDAIMSAIKEATIAIL